jgi:hypothetical protein
MQECSRSHQQELLFDSNREKTLNLRLKQARCGVAGKRVEESNVVRECCEDLPSMLLVCVFERQRAGEQIIMKEYESGQFVMIGKVRQCGGDCPQFCILFVFDDCAKYEELSTVQTQLANAEEF